MKRASLIALVVVALLVGGFFGGQIPMKIKYDKSRDQLLEQAPPFATHPLDGEMQAFLQSVRAEWKVHDQDLPDAVFSEISSVTGLDESVHGVVEFHTYEIPEFSFFKPRRNAQEAVMATTMAVALPVSVDQRIYVGDGICFIKFSDSLVEVYADTDDGLRRTRYWKGNGGKQGGGGTPAAHSQAE